MIYTTTTCLDGSSMSQYLDSDTLSSSQHTFTEQTAYVKGTVIVIFKWPSVQRWQFLTANYAKNAFFLWLKCVKSSKIFLNHRKDDILWLLIEPNWGVWSGFACKSQCLLFTLQSSLGHPISLVGNYAYTVTFKGKFFLLFLLHRVTATIYFWSEKNF